MSRNADLPFKTAGLEFVEFATQAPAALGEVFASLGFKAIARHVSKNVTLYRQGDMNFLVNAEADSFAHRWAEEYGVGICAIGIRVNDAQHAYDRAVELGAWPAETEPLGPTELVIPAIQGVGDTHLYFVDRWRGKHGAKGGLGDISIYDIDFRPLDQATAHEDWHHVGVGLARVE